MDRRLFVFLCEKFNFNNRVDLRMCFHAYQRTAVQTKEVEWESWNGCDCHKTKIYQTHCHKDDALCVWPSVGSNDVNVE
jgi:hypothetical protein